MTPSANSLSAARLLSAPLFLWVMLSDLDWAPLAAALLFVAAVASDLADGPLARRRGTAGPLGRALDHGADFAFVMAGLGAAAARGSIPWALPIAVALAFAQYVIDSLVLHRERTLRMSALGRWNGILYFVPVGGEIAQRLLTPLLVGPLRLVALVLVATTAASMLDRLLALRRPPRTAPGSPGAGRSARSPR